MSRLEEAVSKENSVILFVRAAIFSKLYSFAVILHVYSLKISARPKPEMMIQPCRIMDLWKYKKKKKS